MKPSPTVVVTLHFYKTVYLLARRGDPNNKVEPMSFSFPRVLDARRQRRKQAGKPRRPAGARTSYRPNGNLAHWLSDTDKGGGSLLGPRDRQPSLATFISGEASSPLPTTSAPRASRPTHPELLDWLAADLVEHGWQPQAACIS